MYYRGLNYEYLRFVTFGSSFSRQKGKVELFLILSIFCQLSHWK